MDKGRNKMTQQIAIAQSIAPDSPPSASQNRSNAYSKDQAAILFPDNRLSADTPLRQAQLVMLRILKIFDAICKKHNLKYWLDAGTLLGAARHGGFIPWDDDVDVIMPIDDYNSFLEIAPSEIPFDIFFQTKQTDSEHDISWTKLRDRFSYMDDPGGPYPYCQGIPIDIFPVYVQTQKEFKTRNIRGLLPPFSNNPLSPSPRFSLKHNAYNIVWGFIQHITNLFFKISFIKKSYLRSVQKKDLKNKLENLDGITYNPVLPWFQFFPLDCIYPLSTIKFEDAEFSAPADVNRYLTIYYGDWRTPPPENKRDQHSVLGIHLTDAGPSQDKNSLNWHDYNK